MKVVLKDPILKKLRDRITAAKKELREVDYILLTDEELYELENQVGSLLRMSPWLSPSASLVETTFKVIDLVDPDTKAYGRNWRFASRGSFEGYEVYVVPARFCR